MGVTKDLTGRKFGRLLVVQKTQKPPGSKNRHTWWTCRCDCGKEVKVASDKLVGGDTKSCGCLKIEVATKRIIESGKPHVVHGQSGSRLYDVYYHMLQRCYDPKTRNFHRYGQRGIRVCDEWKDNPKSFFDWAIKSGYADDLTIDRINNDGNYCPENCKWSTLKEQANNKSTNRIVVVAGKEMTLAQLSDKTGIKLGTLWWRVKHGWSGEMLAAPVKKKGA